MYTYKECRRRAQLCALALSRLGVSLGDRVATMAWNNARHLEAWCALIRPSFSLSMKSCGMSARDYYLASPLTCPACLGTPLWA